MDAGYCVNCGHAESTNYNGKCSGSVISNAARGKQAILFSAGVPLFRKRKLKRYANLPDACRGIM